TINREDISILGQAIIAAAAGGYIKDISETIKRIVKEKKVFHPDEKNHRVYSEYFSRYKKMLMEDANDMNTMPAKKRKADTRPFD
ncbi:MAG: hypothetical protein KAR18_10780, partial [Spirochaetes bacterium]|nr:hypothetical protein [Spirochaetota bacterium]